MEKQSVVVAAAEEVVSFVWPIAEDDYIRLTSPYGHRNPEEIGGYGDSFHNGLDIAGVWMARIVSVADGKVVEHWPAPNGFYKGHPVLGGYIRIDHGDGTESKYGHLSSTIVHEGDEVKAGQMIGRQGNTGKSQNAHLHFGLMIDGVEVNPLKYLDIP